MRLFSPGVLAGFLTLSISAAAAQGPSATEPADMPLAQPSARIAQAMEQMRPDTGVRQIGGVELSPDGKQIAWTLAGGQGGGRRGGGGQLHQ